MTKNFELSEQTRRKIKAQAKGCFYNAYKAISEVLPKALYVEGWIKNDNGLVIEHAWLEDNGQIIDPTLLDDFPYFPAMKLTLEQLRKAIEKNRLQLPVAYNILEPGKHSDLFNQALDYFSIHLDQDKPKG